MDSPRAEGDRKRSAGERWGPEPLILQHLSTIVVSVAEVANELAIRGDSGGGAAPGQESAAVRQLFPEAVEAVEPLDVYRDVPVVDGRPMVRLNMIAAVDGATAVDGRSGALGGPADHRVFAALRSLADVVLVAAGTVRAEGYGPAPLPIAVVSGTLELDWDSP